jgi:hypothetical protein
MAASNPKFPQKMNDSTPDPSRKLKIAVIAVHGVADQQPEDTANTTTNLLLHLDTDGSPPPPPRYSGFKMHRLRIANRPVRLSSSAPDFRGRDDSEKCQHEFLRGQLEKYKEPDPSATYQTIRNEGVRRDPTAGAESEVHIYEMYWADLSRLGNSFLTFFVELYQLLFHLCTVAAKTARFVAAQHPTRAWKTFSGSIHLASHFIRLPIPIGNLFVLALVALAASAQIPEDSPLVRTIVIAVACLGVGAAVAFGLRKIVAPRLWPCVLIAMALIVALLWLVLRRKLNSAGVSCLLHVEVWAVLLFLLWKVLKAYDKRHPGAREWGRGIGLLATALLVGFAIWRDPNVLAACTFSAKILLRGLGLFWTFTIFAAAFAWFIGLFAIKGTDPAARPRARRAVFTANLVTALTGFVMLVINISLWGLVALLLRKVPAKYDTVTAIGESIRTHLTTETILPGMTTLLLLMAAGSLWAVWSLVPTVRSEIQTPPPESKTSDWIGQSLTNAFRVMTWSGYIAIACFSFLFAIAILLHIAKDPVGFLVTWDKAKAATVFGSFSGFILLFLIAPFFLKGFIVKLSAGFRQGLDIALDVINYLRENPVDYTIRAQIFARYISLLRYVCNWKSPIDGAGYDRIVIFAHSQGTIITVDLLRFLKVEPDPELKSLEDSGRIRLFTMGCPLRQLYGLRFPHLYGWARHPGDARHEDDLPADQPPDPKDLLSVDQWVNAYRSGDYVGRNLWRSEKDKDVYAINVVVHDSAKTRREFCIGGGAHIHYWDKTAEKIVEELDRLIATV